MFFSFLKIAVAVLVFSSFAAITGEDRVTDDRFFAASADSMRTIARESGFLPFKEIPEAFDSYQSYYSLPVEWDYRCTVLRVNGYQIFTQSYLHPQARGTVLLVHGYLDHSGSNSRAIRFFLERGYSVLLFDLPGHGLSTGEAATIDDFSTYGFCVKKVTAFAVEKGFVRPYIAVGHSTGCAAIYESLVAFDPPIDYALFISPLIRSYLYDLSLFGLYLTPFIGSYPGRTDASTSDDGYRNFFVKDPLHQKYAMRSWFEALKEWNKRNIRYDPVTTPLQVFTAEKDTAVDNSYNCRFLRDHFTNADFFEVTDAKHAILNEREEVRSVLYSRLKSLLEHISLDEGKEF